MAPALDLMVTSIALAIVSGLARWKLAYWARPVGAAGVMAAVGLFTWSGFPDVAAAPALASIALGSIFVGAMDALVARMALPGPD